MNKKFVALLALTIYLGLAATAEPEEENREMVNKIYDRQRQFYDERKRLTESENEIGEELNSEIALYNQAPTVAILQRVEDLKVKIIENLQEQIRNDKGYISYLERKISELLDYKLAGVEIEETPFEIEEEAAEELIEPAEPRLKFLPE